MSSEFDELATHAGSADSLSERMKAGGLIPDGLYKAILCGAKKINSKAKDTPGWELTFEVTEGTFAKQQMHDTLWITDNDRSKDRLALFAHRLGVLRKREDGKLERHPEKQDFMDVLDTPCVIDIITETYKKENGGGEGKSNRLTFCGVFTVDDPEVPKLIEQRKNGPKPTGDKTAAKSESKSETKSESKSKKKTPVDDL